MKSMMKKLQGLDNGLASLERESYFTERRYEPEDRAAYTREVGYGYRHPETGFVAPESYWDFRNRTRPWIQAAYARIDRAARQMAGQRQTLLLKGERTGYWGVCKCGRNRPEPNRDCWNCENPEVETA